MARGHKRIRVSVGHARQRLETVFLKMGVSRQAELVALLAKMTVG
ncbi:MAG TPA: hypothetical protein VJQ47_08560 [Steroidobacteraceae bacterium]|nr:hypothetical protein [Steroidobacteraceae bacterium]